MTQISLLYNAGRKTFNNNVYHHDFLFLSRTNQRRGTPPIPEATPVAQPLQGATTAATGVGSNRTPLYYHKQPPPPPPTMLYKTLRHPRISPNKNQQGKNNDWQKKRSNIIRIVFRPVLLFRSLKLCTLDKTVIIIIKQTFDTDSFDKCIFETVSTLRGHFTQSNYPLLNEYNCMSCQLLCCQETHINLVLVSFFTRPR